jgi:hypothetical protein
MSDSLDNYGYVLVNDYMQVKYGTNLLSKRDLEDEVNNKLKENDIELLKEQRELFENNPNNKKVNTEKLNANTILNLINNDDDEKSEKSNSSTQVENNLKDCYYNIFSLGDVISSKNEKTFYFAKLQADLLVKNIKTIEFSNEKKPLSKNIKKFNFLKTRILMIEIGRAGVIIWGNKIYSLGSSMNKFKTILNNRAFNDYNLNN